MNNVILIGMPGAGKSTVGVVLAKVLGFDFCDTDLLIQQQEQRRLPELLEQHGIDGFSALENRVLSRVDAKNTVIATGGSAVYAKEGMRHLKELGTVVYLKTSFDEVQKRLGDLHHRGVVIKKDQTLRALYDERTPLYEAYADFTVDERDMTLEATVKAVLDALR